MTIRMGFVRCRKSRYAHKIAIYCLTVGEKYLIKSTTMTLIILVWPWSVSLQVISEYNTSISNISHNLIQQYQETGTFRVNSALPVTIIAPIINVTVENAGFDMAQYPLGSTFKLSDEHLL